MEQTYVSWAMVLIGLGAASAGVSGSSSPRPAPRGRALAGARRRRGRPSLFLLQIAGGFGDPESVALAFLIASGIGFAAVIGGLAVLIRRVRGA